MRIIADAGPIIALSKIGHLDLLPLLFDEIVIPSEVLREVASRGETRPGCEIATVPWALVRTADPQQRRKVQAKHDIDEGEAEAILLAQVDARNSVVLMDDEAGIDAVHALGLRSLRVGALLVRAVERKLLAAEVVPKALSLLREERYLGPQAEQDILSLLRAVTRRST